MFIDGLLGLVHRDIGCLSDPAPAHLGYVILSCWTMKADHCQAVHRHELCLEEHTLYDPFIRSISSLKMPCGTNLTPMTPSGGRRVMASALIITAHIEIKVMQNKILDYCTAFYLKKQYVKQHTGISNSSVLLCCHMTSLLACLK